MAVANSNIHLRLDGSGEWTGACEPEILLRCNSRTKITTLIKGDEVAQQWNDPLEALAWMARYVREEENSRWIGYLGYDLGRLFENLPTHGADDLNLPLFCFGLQHDVGRPSGRRITRGVLKDTPQIRSTFTRNGYIDAVRRAIEFIAAGDIFQVNLSQRFTAELPDDPATIYQRLLADSPSIFGGLLQFEDFALDLQLSRTFFSRHARPKNHHPPH